MMVGDPFSGKTQVLQVLAETLNVLTDRGYDDENVNKVSSQLERCKVVTYIMEYILLSGNAINKAFLIHTELIEVSFSSCLAFAEIVKELTGFSSIRNILLYCFRIAYTVTLILESFSFNIAECKLKVYTYLPNCMVDIHLY